MVSDFIRSMEQGSALSKRETLPSALFLPRCIMRTVCLAGWAAFGWTHWSGSSHLQKGLTWGQARASGIWTSSPHHDSSFPCGSLEVGSSENAALYSGRGCHDAGPCVWVCHMWQRAGCCLGAVTTGLYRVRGRSGEGLCPKASSHYGSDRKEDVSPPLDR